MSDLQIRGPLWGGTGTPSPFTASGSGAQRVSDAHGRYMEGAIRGGVFYAANQAGIATPVGLTTASKNFTLYNPLGSNKYCVVLDVLVQAQSNAASGGLYLVGNLTSTQTAPGTVTSETVQNALLGGAAGVAKVYNTATLAATPVIMRPLPGLVFTTSGMLLGYARDEIAGQIIIPPGIYISIQGSAAFTLVCGMSWEEVTILS